MSFFTTAVSTMSTLVVALMLETWVVSFAMKAMGLIITVILYGRMIEIYIYASVGPLPFATFMNREWGNIGTNYVRGLAALGLQGFFRYPGGRRPGRVPDGSGFKGVGGTLWGISP